MWVKKCPQPVEFYETDEASYLTVPKPKDPTTNTQRNCEGYSPEEQLWAQSNVKKLITTEGSLTSLIKRIISGDELESTRFYTMTRNSYIEIQHNTNANAASGNWGEGYVTKINKNG